MVAIVAGNGLGLFNTSLNTLGGGGVFGQGGLGQAGGQGFVNASNGNLILQFSDEQLSGLGLDLFHLRTYNAQGSVSDGDADGWRWDGERRLVLSGTRNATGSTVTRTTGDGHQTIYSWNGSRYVSSEGDGAHDSLEVGTFLLLLPTEWIWTDGSSRAEERYDLSTGRLKSYTNASGERLTRHLNRQDKRVQALLARGQGKGVLDKVLAAAQADASVYIAQAPISPLGSEIGKVLLAVSTEKVDRDLAALDKRFVELIAGSGQLVSDGLSGAAADSSAVLGARFQVDRAVGLHRGLGRDAPFLVDGQCCERHVATIGADAAGVAGGVHRCPRWCAPPCLATRLGRCEDRIETAFVAATVADRSARQLWHRGGAQGGCAGRIRGR